jgi:hypothetical protein
MPTPESKFAAAGMMSAKTTITANAQSKKIDVYFISVCDQNVPLSGT